MSLKVCVYVGGGRVGYKLAGRRGIAKCPERLYKAHPGL